jgi:hypothetical protein
MFVTACGLAGHLGRCWADGVNYTEQGTGTGANLTYTGTLEITSGAGLSPVPATLTCYRSTAQENALSTFRR